MGFNLCYHNAGDGEGRSKKICHIDLQTTWEAAPRYVQIKINCLLTYIVFIGRSSTVNRNNNYLAIQIGSSISVLFQKLRKARSFENKIRNVKLRRL